MGAISGASTTSTLGSTVYATIITAQILQELRAYNVQRPHFRVGPPGPSPQYTFTIQSKVAASNFSSIAEGYAGGLNYLSSGLPYTAVNTTGAAVTAYTKGIATFVTDQAIVESVLDVLPQFSAVLNRTALEQYETDLAAFTAFTNSSGSLASPLTMSTLLLARGALTSRDVTGSLITVLHTKQAQDLQIDIANSGSTFIAAGAGGVSDVLNSGLSGEVGVPFGIRAVMTQVVATSGSGYNGYMCVSGEALGLYELWGVRTELQRQAASVGTDVVVTAMYGLGKISDDRGQTVASVQ